MHRETVRSAGELSTTESPGLFKNKFSDNLLTAENVSYMTLLSILLSRFLMKMLPRPDLRMDGSRCDHMIRTGLPMMVSKFIVSRTRSAGGEAEKRKSD